MVLTFDSDSFTCTTNIIRNMICYYNSLLPVHIRILDSQEYEYNHNSGIIAETLKLLLKKNATDLQHVDAKNGNLITAKST